MTNKDRSEFEGYCRGCTNAQLRNVYDKEKSANRRAYAGIAKAELERRGEHV